MNHSSRGKKRSAGATRSPYVQATNMGARLWRSRAVVCAGDDWPSFPMRRLDTDSAQRAAGRAHDDRERLTPICDTGPGRRALLATGLGRRAHADARRGSTRALPALRRRARLCPSAGPRYVRARPGRLRRHRRGPGRRHAWAAGRRSSGISSVPRHRRPRRLDLSLRRWGPGAGAGVKVAVVDTGVATPTGPPYRRSPDLPAKRMRPWLRLRGQRCLPQRSQRATGPSSPASIAAAADNHFGMIGVAYRADIMPVRVLDSPRRGHLVGLSPAASATPSTMARR